MSTAATFPPDHPQTAQPTIGPFEIDMRHVIIEVRGLTTEIALDVKEAAGMNGAALTYQGRRLARFTIEFRAGHGQGDAPYEAEVVADRISAASRGFRALGRDSGMAFTPANGYAILCRLAEIAFRGSGGVAGAKTTARVAVPIPVSHPLLAMAGVNAMVVEKIQWPERQDDLSYVMTWECVQYAPPPPKNQSVTYPMQGDLLNPVGDNLSGSKYGPAPASTTSPQLPQPPSATPTKP